MKGMRGFILADAFLLFCGLVWLGEHHLRASESILLDDGTSLQLRFTESLFVMLDPHVNKTLNIRTGETHLYYENWSEDYRYSLLLLEWNEKKYWLIQNRSWNDLIAPYNTENSAFHEYYSFKVPANADTLYHLTFEGFTFHKR
jgi:hypothetical protein